MVDNSSALGDPSGPLTVSGGTLDLDGNSLTVGSLSGGPDGAITDTAAGYRTATLTVAQAGDTSFGGAIEDGRNGQTPALVMDGAGTLVLTGANTYTGGTGIDGGTLELADSGALGYGGLTIDDGGTLDLWGATQAISSLTLANGSVGGGSITADGSLELESGTISANLGGWGALTKSGSGTVILSGTDACTGGTQIEAGTLQVDGGLAGAKRAKVILGAGWAGGRTTQGIARRWRGERVVVRSAA